MGKSQISKEHLLRTNTKVTHRKVSQNHSSFLKLNSLPVSIHLSTYLELPFAHLPSLCLPGFEQIPSLVLITELQRLQKKNRLCFHGGFRSRICYLTAVRREKAGFYLSILFREVGRTDLHPVHGFSDLIKMVS